MENRLTYILLSVMLWTSSLAHAQQVALDSAVRHGRLDNGLTYYIRHNAMPKNRCEFHIVQKVGSVLEEENQRGLAHFLEHMAFNGTKHFPGKSLINYLESNGLQFGTNINAYTSIDETIYSLTDVPARQALVDSCVLILHDWAGCITLDPKEIDAERKVIHEEWRTKNSAQSRMYEATLKQLFPEDNPYGTRLPIGLMSVVDNFEHKALRDYYRKWYRPDLQGIIIVGDINVDEVEKTIHRLWRDIKKPVNPAPRTYFSVPDNTEPIVATAFDKEANRNTLKLSYKRDDTPDSMRCDVNVMRDEYITSMASMLLDMRLKTTAEDYRGIMTAPSAADSYYSVAATKRATMLTANFHTGRWSEAMAALIREVKRAIVYGITETEFERLKTNMMQSINQSYQSRHRVANAHYAGQLQQHFLKNMPATSVEQYCALYMEILQSITLNDVNRRLQQLITDYNLAITIQGEDHEELPHPTREQILAAYSQAWQQQVSPYEETTTAKELMEVLPKKGSIICRKHDSKYGTDVLKLSNGATVILRHSAANKNEIMLRAYSPGGTSMYDDSEYAQYSVANSVAPRSGLANFSGKELGRMLEGRSVSYNTSIGMMHESIMGSCAPGDEETLLKLIHLRMTTVRKDTADFKVWQQQQLMQLQGRKRMPMAVFSDSLAQVMYGTDCVRMSPPNKQRIIDADYDRICEIYRERFGNASDFTFVIVGNYNLERITSLIEQYLASLPSTGKHEKARNVTPKVKPGTHILHMTLPATTPKTTVMYQIIGKMAYSAKNMYAVRILQQVLDMMYTEQIREQEGGTYGVNVQINLARTPKNHLQMVVNFDTSKEQAEALLSKVRQCLNDVAKNGPDMSMYGKAMEYMQKTAGGRRSGNAFWMQAIMQNIQYGSDDMLHNDDSLDKITPKDVKRIAQVLIKSGNTTEAILNVE